MSLPERERYSILDALKERNPNKQQRMVRGVNFDRVNRASDLEDPTLKWREEYGRRMTDAQVAAEKKREQKYQEMVDAYIDSIGDAKEQFISALDKGRSGLMGNFSGAYGKLNSGYDAVNKGPDMHSVTLQTGPNSYRKYSVTNPEYFKQYMSTYEDEDYENGTGLGTYGNKDAQANANYYMQVQSEAIAKERKKALELLDASKAGLDRAVSATYSEFDKTAAEVLAQQEEMWANEIDYINGLYAKSVKKMANQYAKAKDRYSNSITGLTDSSVANDKAATAGLSKEKVSMLNLEANQYTTDEIMQAMLIAEENGDQEAYDYLNNILIQRQQAQLQPNSGATSNVPETREERVAQ